MKLLVVGEFSGTIRDAFAAKGHDAWSCDLIESETCGNHLIMDNDMHLKDTLYNRRQNWDFVIGHPVCRFLANSNTWYVQKHGLIEEVRRAAIFFNMILNCPAKYICVENPVHNKYAKQYIRKQDQTIQPYQFGEDASKRTCLWLKNLPLLQPTKIIKKKIYANQTPTGQNKLGPSATRSADRARTYPGIAAAMANQWNLSTTKNFTV